MVVYRRRWKSIFVSYSLVRHTQWVLMRIASVCVLFYFFERLWKFSVRLWAQFYRHKFVYAHIKRKTNCLLLLLYIIMDFLRFLFDKTCALYRSDRVSLYVCGRIMNSNRSKTQRWWWMKSKATAKKYETKFFCSTKLAKWSKKDYENWYEGRAQETIWLRPTIKKILWTQISSTMRAMRDGDGGGHILTNNNKKYTASMISSK